MYICWKIKLLLVLLMTWCSYSNIPGNKDPGIDLDLTSNRCFYSASFFDIWAGEKGINDNILYLHQLTHWGRVTHICVGYLTIIGSDNSLSPSHYLNQCWNIVNWTPRNKLQWNVNRNSYIFIQENPFENIVWKLAAILSRPQCVNEI